MSQGRGPSCAACETVTGRSRIATPIAEVSATERIRCMLCPFSGGRDALWQSKLGEPPASRLWRRKLMKSASCAGIRTALGEVRIPALDRGYDFPAGGARR